MVTMGVRRILKCLAARERRGSEGQPDREGRASLALRARRSWRFCAIETDCVRDAGASPVSSVVRRRTGWAPDALRATRCSPTQGRFQETDTTPSQACSGPRVESVTIPRRAAPCPPQHRARPGRKPRRPSFRGRLEFLFFPACLMPANSPWLLLVVLYHGAPRRSRIGPCNPGTAANTLVRFT